MELTISVYDGRNVFSCGRYSWAISCEGQSGNVASYMLLLLNRSEKLGLTYA